MITNFVLFNYEESFSLDRCVNIGIYMSSEIIDGLKMIGIILVFTMVSLPIIYYRETRSYLKNKFKPGSKSKREMG